MGEGEKGNCTYIPANMAGEEVAKLIVGSDSGMCAKDVFIDQEQFLCVNRDEETDEERDEDEKRERELKMKRDRDENEERQR